MPSHRFLAALEALPARAHEAIGRWTRSHAPAAHKEHLRQAILSENHLEPPAFVHLLEVLAGAILLGQEWSAAFRKCHLVCTLCGDVVPLNVELLDRIIRRSLLGEGYEVPAWAAGATQRYYDKNIPESLRRLKLARNGHPVFCSFMGVQLTGVPSFVSSPRNRMGTQWYEGRSALAVRALLGLGHFKPYANLVMLTYRHPDSLQLRCPTVVDADGDEYFATSLPTDPCGVTKTLSTGQRGLPEAVHENLEIDDLLELVYDLGTV